MTDAASEEHLSDCDSSFIVIGVASIPPDLNEKCYCTESHGDLFKEVKSNGILESIKSTTNEPIQVKSGNSNSFFEGGTQEKVDQLLRENYQLKETLNQNNLAIKSQLNTFFTWQQEVLKTHETHKKKFSETKELILKLRASNEDLKKQLDDSLKRFSIVSNGDIGPISSSDTGSAKHTHVKEETDNLKEVKKFQQICEELTIKNEHLSVENRELKEKLNEAQKEIINITRDLEDNKTENMLLKIKNNEYSKNVIENVRGCSLPNSEARAQISNLFKQLEEEKAKVLKLKEELQIAKLNNSIAMECKLSTAEELTHYLNKLDDVNVSFTKPDQSFSIVSLSNENASNGDVIVDTKGSVVTPKITQLKSDLYQEENALMKKQENLQEIHSQFYKLSEDYKDLQQKLTLLEADGPIIEKYKDDIKSLSAQLKAKDEELICKQQECDEMKENLEKLNLKCEEFAVLKVQVGLYENDFHDERAARERLVGEKEEMAERIRLLEYKIKDLNIQKNEENTELSSFEFERTNSPLEFRHKDKTPRFICPKCMFSFSDLKRCEEHVDECLDIHFYP